MLKSIVKNNIVKYTAEQQIKINKANLNMINWNLIKKRSVIYSKINIPKI